MKKYIAIFTLLLVCRAGYSQTYSVDRIFKDFSRIEQAEKVKLGQFFMSFASMFSETMGVKGIEVYDFDECATEIKERLSHAIKNLKDPDFETMISTNEEGSRTKILVRMEKETIRELVILTTGDSNALIRIKGKIKPSDFEQVAQKHGKGGC